MQDSQQQHAHLNHFIGSLLNALTVAPQSSVPTTAPAIHLSQMGNNPNLLQAKCVTSVPDAPIRVYSGNPKVILPIILDLMTDKTSLVAEDNSELVFESMKFLTHSYTFNKQQPDDGNSNDLCRTCDGCQDCDAKVEPVEDEEHDSVYNPSHYQLPGLDGLEVMDVRSSLLKTIPEGVPYELVTSWNESWTYLTRMWGKNGLEDAKKAQVYLNRLIDLWEDHNHSH